MNRTLLVVLLVVLLAAGAVLAAVTWMRSRSEPEWTSRSAQAAEELEAGIEDFTKYYWPDARAHLERALELDPELAVARVFLLWSSHKSDERAKLVASLEETDLERLADRERFLVRYALSNQRRDEDATRALVEEYLAAHPEDPWASNARCDLWWRRHDWEQASRCYRDLLEAYPNWVQGQNRLGYIAMAQGRFTEAEEHFRTYQFIAPDQANPYDSLGYLLTLLGRYEESREALEQAVEIKDDFCETYTNLVRLDLYTGDFEGLADTVERAADVEACAAEAEYLGCTYGAWARQLEGDPHGAWIEYQECAGESGPKGLLAHRLALLAGDTDAALDLEAKVEQAMAEMPEDREHAKLVEGAALRHMRGFRSLLDGDAATAADLLEEADERLAYWGGEVATLKLFNRSHLAYALALAGRDVEAKTVRRKIEAVNPRFFDGILARDVEHHLEIGHEQEARSRS